MKRWSDRFGILIALTLLLRVNTAMAVPATPNGIDVAQPDGQTIRITMKGDEFFSWTETNEGYATVKDPKDGFWKYAKPASNAVGFQIISDARVGKRNPRLLGLQPHGLPDQTAVSEFVTALRDQTRGIQQNEGKRAPKSLRKGDEATPPSDTENEPPVLGIPVSGNTNIRNIVILAAFSDHWDSTTSTVRATQGRVNTLEYKNLFNEVGHTTDGSVGSVRDYYREVSYGKLTVDSVITPWVKLPRTESYYGSDGSTTDTNWQQMVSDAITAAEAAGFDFSQGDSDADGWVDCLTIIHSGHGQEYTSNPTTEIWSKQGELGSVVTLDGVNMKRCHIEPALRGAVSSTGIIRIGVICHEMGHFFGLPDLYDYSNLTSGLGNWDIMATGSWNGNGDGKRPAHFSAWSKYMLGFVQPEEVHSANTLSLARIEDNAVAHLIRDGLSDGEYFLVENRANVGFDNSSEIFPGMLIYHVYSQSANNDLGTWQHPVVKIEEADGDNSLGTKAAGSESGDVWKSGNGLAGGFRDQTFNSATNAMRYQNTHYYNRTNTSVDYSYIQLNSFSAPNTIMTYALSTLEPTVDSQSVEGNAYTVTWSPATNASFYEIQEGTPVTQHSFTDDAENEDFTYENWNVAGMATHDNNGAHNGAYSYAMHRYFGGKWYPTVQTLTMKKSFTVTATTALSFYLMSHTYDAGYLKCQISNDAGNTWKTLDVFGGYIDPWTRQSYDFNAIQAIGIGEHDECIVRFVANFEQARGWASFPGYGYALDDIALTGIGMSAYDAWTTLSDSITDTRYEVQGRGNGDHAYRVRANANGIWQDYGTVGIVGVTKSAIPVSTTITSTTSDPTSISPIPVTVTFSVDVTGFEASDIVTGNAILANFSGSGNTYQFDLIPTTAGLVTADIAAGVCVDADGNENTAAIQFSRNFAIEGPSVASILRKTAETTNLSTLAWIVTFTEPVAGVDLTDFELVTTGITGAALTSVTGSGAIWTVTAVSGTGNGSMGLNVLDDDSIRNIDDAPLGGIGVGNGNYSGSIYLIDKIGPTVTLTSVTPAGPTTAASIHVCAQWNEATVLGFDAADLNVINATITNFTGSSPYYEFDLNPVNQGTVTVQVGSSKATDVIGNKNMASNKLSWTYDRTAPYIVSITRKYPELTNRSIVSWSVIFSEAVTGVDSTDFVLTSSEGIVGAAITTLSGSKTTWTITAGTGTGNGLLYLTLLDDGSIQDIAGNSLVAMGSEGSTSSTSDTPCPAYQLDKTPPVPVLSATPAPGYIGLESVHINVVWSKSPITGFDETDITVTNATVANFTGSSPYYEFDVIPLGQGTMTVQIPASKATDVAGNKNTASQRLSWICDSIAPNVSAIVCKYPDPTNRTSVAWTVTFSEPVLGVDATDFVLIAGGDITDVAIISVTGSKAVWTITASTGTGSGTLGLSLIDDDTITDLRGNPLGESGPGNGNFTGSVYQVDKTKPEVTSLTIANGVLSTTTATVTLNNVCTGNPAWYLASESSTFADAVWLPYTANPEFTLSTGGGKKIVYFKVKTLAGTSSNTKTDTITLCDTITLMLPGDVPLELIRIPAGKFMMGSPVTEQDRQSCEGPQHQVTLTQDYYLGVTPVTKRQWTAMMGTTPWAGQDNTNPDSPAVCVSWEDAQTFIAAVNTLGQGLFTLPTEAQWEYACRAGMTTRFFWGDDPSLSLIDLYAWYAANTVAEPYAHQVGLKLPNPFTVYDLTGNVWEWCNDWFGFYTSRAATDPVGPVSGVNRVLRGGSWTSTGEGCRSASRSSADPTSLLSDTGFRIAR